MNNNVNELMNQLFNDIDKAVEAGRGVVVEMDACGVQIGGLYTPVDVIQDNDGVFINTQTDHVIAINSAHVLRAEWDEDWGYKFIFTLGGYIGINII